MIPFEFAYHRPDTLAEALTLWRDLDAAGKVAQWYAGGTEIISMARMGSIKPDALIDVKALSECGELYTRDGRIEIGACATLSRIAESGVFPLLGQAISRIADHTNQCKITLGGNLLGTIRYREAVLPLLIADAEVRTADATGGGGRRAPIADMFDGRLRLHPGELLLGISIHEAAARWAFGHHKLVRADKIDYPLLTLCAAKDDTGAIRLALSGLCDAPFRSAAMEASLNDSSLSAIQRAQSAARLTPPLLDDGLGGADYRRFRLELALADAIRDLEGCTC